MAVSGSGLFGLTLRDALNGTITLNLDLETHKIALFSNSITPNFSTDTSYGVSPYNANEVTGTGWSSGGVALTGTNLSVGSDILTFDAADVSQSSTTLTNARCGRIYADALTGDNAICLIDFGADYSTVNGTFAITWNASGIFYIDIKP